MPHGAVTVRIWSLSGTRQQPDLRAR
jgi:hypothetical protein